MGEIYDGPDVAENYSKVDISSMNIFPWKKKYLTTVETLLDVGCGQGVTLQFISKYHPKIDFMGVEPSIEMIRKAPFQNNIQHSSAELMQFPKDSFDLVLSRFSFKWFQDKEKALENIHSCLKTNGIFLLYDSGENETREIVNFIVSILGENSDVTAIVSHYFEKYRLSTLFLRKLLDNTGFSVLEQKDLYFVETFDSVDMFLNKWIVGFGVLYELSLLLDESEEKLLQLLKKELLRKFANEVKIKHHNYLIVARKVKS